MPIEKTDANTREAWEMTNDEFGMSNGQKFGLRTSAFARSHDAGGDPKRIALIAADLVAHFEKRVEGERCSGSTRCSWPRTARAAVRFGGVAERGRRVARATFAENLRKTLIS